MNAEPDAESAPVLGGQESTPEAKNGVPHYQHRADVDGLRAFAVIAVVIYHLRPDMLPGGFIGVDIFFVISGYVVCSSLTKRWSRGQDNNHTEFTLDFYARRIQRLFPALVAVYWYGTLLVAFLVPYWTNASFLDSALFGLLGSSNIYFAKEAVSYWEKDFLTKDATKFNFFIHTWSLGVEEQYYVVFAVMVCIVGGMRSRYLTPTVSTVAAGSIAYCFYLQQINPTFAFYLLPARFWELASGALLLLLEVHLKENLFAAWSVMDPILSVLSSLLLGVALVATRSGKQFPLPWVLIAIAGTCCFIAAGWNDAKPGTLNRLFSLPWIVYIGEMSYCIYLVHWPTIVAFKWLSLSYIQESIAAVVLICLLSACLYHLWEKPLRSAKVSRCRVFWMAAAAVFICCLWWLFLSRGGHQLFYEWGSSHSLTRPRTIKPSKASSRQSSKHLCKPKRMVGGIAAFNDPPFLARKHSCQCRWTGHVNPPPGLNWTCKSDVQPCMIERLPQWEGPVDDRTYVPWPTRDFVGEFIDSINDGTFDEHVKKYFKRPPDAKHGVVWLFGDSHAESIALGLDAATWKMKLVLTSTMVWAAGLPTISEESNRTMTPLISGLKQNLQAGDIVAVIYSAPTRLPGWKSTEDMRFTKKHLWSFTGYEARLRELQALVVSKGAKLVLFGDWHSLDHPGSICAGNSALNCSVSKDFLRRHRQMYYGVLQNVSALPHVYYMNLMNILCDGDHCSEKIPGTNTIGFTDTGHLTHAASYYCAPFICQFLRGIVHQRS